MIRSSIHGANHADGTRADIRRKQERARFADFAALDRDVFDRRKLLAKAEDGTTAFELNEMWDKPVRRRSALGGLSSTPFERAARDTCGSQRTRNREAFCMWLTLGRPAIANNTSLGSFGASHPSSRH